MESNISKLAHDQFASFGLNGQEERVEKIKHAASVLFDLYNDISIEPGAVGGRHVSLAKTELEASVMWAVKAISRSKAN
jgi:hypothetical protein